MSLSYVMMLSTNFGIVDGKNLPNPIKHRRTMKMLCLPGGKRFIVPEFPTVKTAISLRILNMASRGAEI